MTLNIILLILGAVCMAASLVLVFKPVAVAAVPAYAGLCLLHWSTFTTFTATTFWFYGIATLMLAGLRHLSPKGEPDGRLTGNLFLGLGAIMGCLVGIAIEARFMLLGTIIGTVMGMLAFTRTPHGRWLEFPKSNFIHYLCAKGFAIVIAVAMAGVAVEGFVFDVRHPL